MAIELLAPAGSPASLKAAVEAGADSVYLGSQWNARMRARNFSQDELALAIAYCHRKGVNAYVTLNVLVFENELKAVADYIKFACESGADALIVQDLGVARMAREIAPSLPLHASTQLSVHNSKTAGLLKGLGFERLILARELSLEQAKRIKKNSGAEVEVFCHGALCYSYSGKCLFSFVQTGRSGNRGACAQMCRFPWKLYCDRKFVKKGYLTSTKDLNTLALVPQMARAGIGCLKIEGRLKDAKYVKAVVAAYRKAIDSGQAPDLASFTARGYTQGYLSGQARKEKLTNPEAPAFSGVKIGQVIRASGQGALVRLSSLLKKGDFIRSSGSGKRVEIYRLYQKGKEVDSASGECTLRIRTLKGGESLYKVERAAAEDDFLKAVRLEKGNAAKPFTLETAPLQFPQQLPRLFYAQNPREINNPPEDTAVVVPLEGAREAFERARRRLVVELPRVVFDAELAAVEKQMGELESFKPLAFMASEPSLVSSYPTIIGTCANLTNTLAARAWTGFGNVTGAIASIELPQSQALELGFIPYSGKSIELMLSENDLFKELDVQEGQECELEDPRGNRFAIRKKFGRTVITTALKQK